MPAEMGLKFSGFQEPLAGRPGVDQGILCGKALGNQDKECRLGFELFQCIGDVVFIYIGDKMDAQVSNSEGLERSVAMTGPRSEPPTPILTMSVIGWPV